MTDRKKWTKMWIVTIDGDPVAGTAAYTRKEARANFMHGGNNIVQWETFKRAGYAVERCAVSVDRRPTSQG